MNASKNNVLEKDVSKRDVILKAIGISKSFPGVKALSNVDFDVRKGEIVALLGENGAGKSTLIKILSGVYQCDAGKIEMMGQEVRFDLPSEATAAGIGIVHQELNYVGTISIAENIYMKDIPRKGIRVDYKSMYKGAKEIIARVGLDLDPRMIVSRCTVAQKQLIEIAKVLSQDVKVLILDEPTSALNDIETEHLFSQLKQAAALGVAIIYISHRMDEIFELADRIVVLRDGCVIGQVQTKMTNKNALIAMMVGRDVSDMYKRQRFTPGDTILEVKNLTGSGLKNISFSARKGQVFGVYGLMGSGHDALGPLIFGQSEIQSGEIRVHGKQVKIRDPYDSLRLGIGYVPAERKSEGVVLNASVLENIMIPYHQKQREINIHKNEEQQITDKWIQSIQIRTPSPFTKVESLSGGNQQKVVLSKWLELEPDILILCEPTRGIDVGAKSEIFGILEDLCKAGKCVIMITSEMIELLSMSDEIAIICNGEITGILSAEEATQETVLKYAIGG